MFHASFIELGKGKKLMDKQGKFSYFLVFFLVVQPTAHTHSFSPVVAGTDHTVRIMQLHKAVLQIFYISGVIVFPVPVPQMTTLEIRQQSNHNLLALRKQMTLFECQILLLVLVLFSNCNLKCCFRLYSDKSRHSGQT